MLDEVADAVAGARGGVAEGVVGHALHERGQAQVETLILMHARRHQRPSLSVALSNLAGRTARRYRLEAERLARERGYRSRMEEEQELRRSYGRER